MRAVQRWLGATSLLAIAAVAWAGLEHERAQRARVEALTRNLAEAREEITSLRVSESSPAPAPVVISAPAIDARVADAIASRVLAASDARKKGEAAIAAQSTAPTDSQLAARAAAERTLDRAIARGRLTRDEILEMRETLADDPLGRAEFRRQLAVALDQKKLVPDDPRLLMP
jgi:hypothetical protein